ncbi:uncharacterized protein PV07_01892 [Cladophialophora immunda]|uniref:Carboxymuconolactone decarboxylase-like domain-containing protein n=1 Tax=Cladophialophora immunda TaxID=569365 RepID=A0A0D2CVP5_9EURO|nr:uncharacterized protein PV07_01892 [Cladophialophora immunda]KIW35178.1 hypothetical protein PV07_01892 [Cladophialophora immunda]OQV04637.1 hypothetical protein CLAIMM_09491 [Cladophialophora immunda]
MATSSDHRAMKDQLIELGEVWSPAWQDVLEFCPEYLAAYLKMRSVPVNNRHLSRKLQELLLLACDASCTHLFGPGIRLHTENALKAGATKGEVLEVLMRTSVLGIHAVSIGLPVLFEVLVEEGKVTEEELAKPNDEYKEQLKAKFTEKRGFWSPHYQKLITIAPDFFEAYTSFSAAPTEVGGHLSPRDRELVYTAIDCATTHLYGYGLKTHVRNAVRLGATPELIVEVYELAGLMGFQTMLLGVPVLKEALTKFDSDKNGLA